MHNIDVRIFYFINKTCQSGFLDMIMPAISLLGIGKVLYPVPIIMLFLKDKTFKGLGMVLLAGYTSLYYIVGNLKEIVAVPRPYVALTGVHVLERAKEFSFPSAHSTFVFFTAYVLSVYFPRGKAIFYVMAVLVGLSRIYLGVHYPSDVIGGALIGTLGGILLIKAARSVTR
ncbi:MAG: phosphatase PAP2 family protein [Candidatus Omnitrophica bacterium]|nr:phosphatase PAP2 family protein [Candidatus Omnitrophota bacterium]